MIKMKKKAEVNDKKTLPVFRLETSFARKLSSDFRGNKVSLLGHLNTYYTNSKEEKIDISNTEKGSHWKNHSKKVHLF